VFNNEIVAYDLADGKHGANPANHIKALKCLIKTKIKRGYKDLETIVHSDQGVIYSSMVFANTHKDYNIKRSMSRAGTPTDNPKMESINGWIKDEIINDWDIDSYDSFDEFINAYVYYYNNERLACSLDYKTPIQYKTELGF
jgi:transposase InsO family protein